MKYRVIFHPEAEQDIRTSFEWGVRVWGEKQAEKWLRELYSICKKRLTNFPESCAIAPESEDLGITIRQLIIDRYRVLFVLDENVVEILYVRGPYIGEILNEI